MKKFIGPLLLSLLVLSAGYGAAAAYFKGHFFPGTFVNGYDSSLMSRDSLVSLLRDKTIGDYELRITDIHGDTSVLSKEELELNVDFPIDSISIENALLWPLAFIAPKSHELEPEVSFSEDRLTELLNERLIEGREAKAPENAYLSGYIPGSGYMIVPERDGDTLNKKRLAAEASEAVYTLERELFLEAEGCYERASVRADDTELQREREERNSLVKGSVCFDFGERRMLLNSDTYAPWLTVSEQGDLQIDELSLKNYLLELKLSTDTAGADRIFKTADGRLVTVNGPYGYRLSIEKELERLGSELLSGEKIEREPEYSSRGVERNSGYNDYGSDYVEIDLSKQRVYLFRGGEMVLETDCVTGNVARGHSTPPGIFPLTYKTTNAILRGPDYESHVSYWMPFNKGIGLHDASWRGRFGGEIYKRSGSHGCINLPISAARALYEELSRGFPVICHY